MQALKTMFRNGCIAATGLAVSGGAFAAIVDADTTGYIEAAKTDGEGVGKLIIGAVAVVVAVSLIIGLMRKA